MPRFDQPPTRMAWITDEATVKLIPPRIRPLRPMRIKVPDHVRRLRARDAVRRLREADGLGNPIFEQCTAWETMELRDIPPAERWEKLEQMRSGSGINERLFGGKPLADQLTYRPPEHIECPSTAPPLSFEGSADGRDWKPLPPPCSGDQFAQQVREVASRWTDNYLSAHAAPPAMDVPGLQMSAEEVEAPTLTVEHLRSLVEWAKEAAPEPACICHSLEDFARVIGVPLAHVTEGHGFWSGRDQVDARFHGVPIYVSTLLRPGDIAQVRRDRVEQYGPDHEARRWLVRQDPMRFDWLHIQTVGDPLPHCGAMVRVGGTGDDRLNIVTCQGQKSRVMERETGLRAWRCNRCGLVQVDRF